MTKQKKPDQDWTDELSSRPGHLIRRCYQILMALYARETDSIGVTPLQYAVLRTINHEPRRSKRRLSEIAGLDRTTVGWIISSLERKDLIRATEDSAHKRIKYFELTRDGQETLKFMDPKLDAMQDLIVKPLSARERTAFIKSAQKIVMAYNSFSRAPLRAEP